MKIKIDKKYTIEATEHQPEVEAYLDNDGDFMFRQGGQFVCVHGKEGLVVLQTVINNLLHDLATAGPLSTTRQGQVTEDTALIGR